MSGVTPTTPADLKVKQERVLALAAQFLRAYHNFGEAMDGRDYPEGSNIPVMGEWQYARREQYHAARNALIEELPALARLVAAHAEALERERWIPVSEAMPEEAWEVQVYVTEVNDLGCFRYQEVSSRVDGRWQWLEKGATVTHWKKLPPPPAQAPASAEGGAE